MSFSPKYVVVGSNGFVGRSLCLRLLSRGAEVLGVGTGAPIQHPAFYHHPIRVVDSSQLVNIFRAGDIVFDAAGIATPATLSDLASSTAFEELGLHRAVLEAARVAAVEKVVLISSGGTVYGDISSDALIDENQHVAPVSAYGRLKVEIEHMVRDASRRGEVGSVICRLANPYGPGQKSRRSQGLVATVFENLLLARPIHIWGDGSAIRDYIYIDDACDALVAAAALQSGATCNVATGIGRSVRDVVADVAATLGRESHPIYEPSKSAGVGRSVLSSLYLRSATAWQPKVPWFHGLGLTATWWMQNIQ